jgi:hypothetical protein
VTYRHLGACVFLLALGCGIRAADVKNRSVSRSGQFIVYCDDREVRSRVVSAAEEIKDSVLRVLRDSDGWSQNKPPIVVTIDPAEPGKPVPPVHVQWMNTIAGPKIDVVARVGDDPAKVFLQRHLIRALLLEMSFRDRPAPKSAYVEPPWWLVEGIIESIRHRDGVGHTDVIKSIVSTDKLPVLEKFVAQPPVHLDTAAGAVDRACAMCLVEALLAFPNGAQNLNRFIGAWQESGGDALGALAAHFPALNGSSQTLAKWWSLQLTRSAGGDRVEGLSIADTEQQLAGILSFDVVVDAQTKKTRRFGIADFDAYVKLPGSRNVLRTAQVKIVTLSTKAAPQFRPVLTEYEEICGLLSAGKSKGIAARIAAIEQYRRSVVQRMGQLVDYLNWYEATQPAARTGVLDSFLKRADELEKKQPVDPLITDYLDRMEKEFAPLQPNAIPGIAPDGAVSR